MYYNYVNVLIQVLLAIIILVHHGAFLDCGQTEGPADKDKLYIFNSAVQQ